MLLLMMGRKNGVWGEARRDELSPFVILSSLGGKEVTNLFIFGFFLAIFLVTCIFIFMSLACDNFIIFVLGYFMLGHFFSPFGKELAEHYSLLFILIDKTAENATWFVGDQVVRRWFCRVV